MKWPYMQGPKCKGSTSRVVEPLHETQFTEAVTIDSETNHAQIQHSETLNAKAVQAETLYLKALRSNTLGPY